MTEQYQRKMYTQQQINPQTPPPSGAPTSRSPFQPSNIVARLPDPSSFYSSGDSGARPLWNGPPRPLPPLKGPDGDAEYHAASETDGVERRKKGWLKALLPCF
ncbi:hypothetical protein CVT24_013092 [Panaeolus cyanescens]|uniref:Uncharacterized protein n=1 Tax=Panaeolus cyanescens TaxID=181874 RepID=A0A409WR19_9AGAR|nr:hypothetical protein CVT24_013092 [Panaeolus cyanescens]